MTEKVDVKLRPPFVHTQDKPAAAAPQTVAPPTVAKEWREFDWKSAASLRAPDKRETKGEREWDATEWNDSGKLVSDEARRVAEQLDGVVQKIRKGELSVEGRAPTPETAMVAALEALIRAK